MITSITPYRGSFIPFGFTPRIGRSGFAVLPTRLRRIVFIPLFFGGGSLFRLPFDENYACVCIIPYGSSDRCCIPSFVRNEALRHRLRVAISISVIYFFVCLEALRGMLNSTEYFRMGLYTHKGVRLISPPPFQPLSPSLSKLHLGSGRLARVR